MGQFERGLTVVLVLWSVLILLGYRENGIAKATRFTSQTRP
jgi:hypothetical protein